LTKKCGACRISVSSASRNPLSAAPFSRTTTAVKLRPRTCSGWAVAETAAALGGKSSV